MIGVLEGTVHPSGAVMTAGGVGYEVSYCGQGPMAAGQKVELLVRMVTRETGSTLWCFDTVAEREVFDALTNVPKIGPTMAGTALRTLGVAGIASCVASGDSSDLKKVKGIGPKAATSIVQLVKLPEGLPTGDGSAVVSPLSRASAVSALRGLGIPAAQAEEKVDAAAESSDADVSVEELVRIALREEEAS